MGKEVSVAVGRDVEVGGMGVGVTVGNGVLVGGTGIAVAVDAIGVDVDEIGEGVGDGGGVGTSFVCGRVGMGEAEG
jgi:hypothetical protein